MNILYLDSSQSYLVIGLQIADRFAEKVILHANKIGSVLSLSIKEFIEESHLSWHDLDKIVVGAGPGSYTGTRVGVAFAETLAFGLDIPLIKIPSLVFYLSEQETCLKIKSQLGTYGYLEHKDGAFFYQQIPASDANTSARTLDPKNLIASPHWPHIERAGSQESLEALLYFSLS